MFLNFSKKLSILSITLLLSGTLLADTILVTNNDGGSSTDGSLGLAIQQALDGDIIDCSPIAGQTINVSGQRLSPLTSSCTILGSGVTIDGGSSFPVFSLAQGSPTITGFIIQNGNSKGANGGSGQTGGGGGTGGGGALYVHSGTTMTISATSLNNNQAVGGNGGSGNTGGSGGGGGGFGGGVGGNATRTGASAGSGGGGGGNNGGTAGGTVGAGSPNTFSNSAGAGGGGEIPGRVGGGGGSVAATYFDSAKTGGSGGQGSSGNGAGAGGGAGSGGNGLPGSNAIDASTPGTGIGGAGGLGIGIDNTYGAGGGGGGGNGGGTSYGASGGGGGLNGPGGNGGALGGGGGASSTSAGGNGGFGAGGGGGHVGGIDNYGLGGSGGSATNAPAGGGGGSGLGGAIFIQQGGQLIIQDGVSFSYNATVPGMGGAASGSSGGNGSSLGEDIFIQSGGSLTFQINDALTLSNPIEGAGFLYEATRPGLVKSGTGTVSLTGDNAYRGGTLIQSGTLNLNGSVSGNVNINEDGTLSGNATVNGNIYNNGMISPGNSIGEIFTTDLFLYSTSVYNVEINAAGNSDTIIASGLAQIDGSVVVTPDDINFITPLTYTIISTGTGVTGEFASLTSSIPSLMSLTYNPLTVQLTYLPLDAIALTNCNALNAANCFSTLPITPGSDAATINNALLALDFDDIQCAFQQMSPAQFSGPTEVQLLDAILIRTTYTKHLQKFYCNEDRYVEHPISLWMDAVAQWQHQGKQFGYKDTTLGATIGVDYWIRDWILGLAFSYTHDHFDWKYFAGKAKINSFYAGLYSCWNHDALYLNVALLGAFNKYKTTRELSFGTIDRCAYAQHNGNEWLPHVGFGYRGCASRFEWTPYINLDYVLLHERSYTEAGAGSLDLHVNSKNARLFQGEAGVSLSTTYHTCNGKFIPMLTLAYINQTPNSNRIYCANFEKSCCTFTGKGGDYERNLFVPRLAFTYQDARDKVNVSIYYDGQVGSKYWAQDVVFDLTFRF